MFNKVPRPMVTFLLCALAVPVVAGPDELEETPEEFWDYMAEYGDEDGNTLDPLEFVQLLSMDEDDVEEINASDAINKPVIRNADMKLKSSDMQSSSSVKGAQL